MGILDPWLCDIFEFCDLDEEVEDEEGNGDGTDGRPIVFGGAAYEPGLISLPAAWPWRLPPFWAGELVFLLAIAWPGTGIADDNVFPDIWLEGRLDAVEEVDDDNGIFDTGDGLADPEAVAEFLGLQDE